MLDAPNHDWDLYEKACRPAHIAWLRSLTPDDALALYEEFHSFVSSQTGDDPGLARLEKLRWEEKVAIRQRMVAAFAALDRMRREGLHTDDAH
jgi:hypothetical protein